MNTTLHLQGNAPPLSLDAPAMVAFDCTPEWLQADAPPTSGDGPPAKPPLPRFSMVAYTGGPMRLAGWRHPVVVDLAGLQIPSPRRPIRLGHDAMHGVGHTESVRVDDGRLMAQGVVSRDTAAAREVVVSAARDFPWQCSIGAAVIAHEFVRDGTAAIVNGREVQGPVNIVRRSALGEISFVDLGADGNTSALVTASITFAPSTSTTPGELPVTTASQPAPSTDTPATTPATAPAQPPVASNVQAAAPTSAQASAPTTPGTIEAKSADDATDATVQRLRVAALAETERISAVRKLCAGRHADLEAKAIGEGWDATRTELEVLRADRPKAPAVHSHQSSITGEILEAAALLAVQAEDVEKSCRPEVLDVAAKRFRNGIGLQELILEAAWANGYTGRTFRDTREVLRAAFISGPSDVRAAGLSTIDLGGILSNLANKFLLEGFNAVESTWRNIATIGPVTDFKTVTRFRLIGKDQYERVAPGGEITHGTLGDTKYTNQADTYGLMLTIDRRDLINDDLGAITTVPRKLGRGAGLKINDVFWTTFLGNAAFFSAANKNLLTGADTGLTIDGLTKAEQAFLEQVDPDGKPLGLMPALILVPPSLSALGSQLFKSLELRETTANAKYPVANPHQGKFRVEVSRYLSHPQIPGSSNKAWYLLADPADLAVIEVVFLNGQEAPTVDSAQADFNTLGVQMRGIHDFGVGLQEPRAGLKSKGEA